MMGGGGRGGNRQMRRMMDKMGMDMEEVNNVQEVIIKTDKKEIIISKPAVTESFIKGHETVPSEVVQQFAQPTKATLNVDLTDNPIVQGLNEFGESLDEAFDNV